MAIVKQPDCRLPGFRVHVDRLPPDMLTASPHAQINRTNQQKSAIPHTPRFDQPLRTRTVLNWPDCRLPAVRV
eukprot:347418-Chlamydomonas_euryale.AAC.1